MQVTAISKPKTSTYNNIILYASRIPLIKECFLSLKPNTHASLLAFCYLNNFNVCKSYVLLYLPITILLASHDHRYTCQYITYAEV